MPSAIFCRAGLVVMSYSSLSVLWTDVSPPIRTDGFPRHNNLDWQLSFGNQNTPFQTFLHFKVPIKKSVILMLCLHIWLVISLLFQHAFVVGLCIQCFDYSMTWGVSFLNLSVWCYKFLLSVDRHFFPRIWKFSIILL